MPRNEKVQELKPIRGKLTCSCKDPLFIGIPCRHLLTLTTKEESIEFKCLPFTKRQEKCFYTEDLSGQDSSELVIHEKNPEVILSNVNII